MSDLVDRGELLKEMTCLWDEALGTCACVLEEDINKAPAVDAVEVVRCFECVKRGNSIECPMCHDEVYEDDGGYNEWYAYDNTDDEGFCHYGERKKEDAVD